MRGDAWEEMLRWVARRVVLGEPVGVGAVARHFEVDAETAQLVMGGGWGRFVAAEREAVEQPLVCQHCGDRFGRRASKTQHERTCVEGFEPLRPPGPPPPTACPRCGGRLIRNYDELVCLAHGTMWDPVRAWDLGSMGVPPTPEEAKASPIPGGRPRLHCVRGAQRLNGTRATCPRCGREVTRLDMANGHEWVCVGGLAAEAGPAAVGDGGVA